MMRGNEASDATVPNEAFPNTGFRRRELRRIRDIDRLHAYDEPVVFRQLDIFAQRKHPHCTDAASGN